MDWVKEFMSKEGYLTPSVIVHEEGNDSIPDCTIFWFIGEESFFLFFPFFFSVPRVEPKASCP
jgi:hypothetical protein